MKINSINNMSFGAIYLEQNGKAQKINKKNVNKVLKNFDVSKTQKGTVKYILNNRNLTDKLVKNLEKVATDIYISPKPYSNEVKLTLYSDIDWFGNKVIPYDGRYTSKMQTLINPEFQGDLVANMRISNFFQRANDMDFGSDKNIALVNNALAGVDEL